MQKDTQLEQLVNKVTNEKEKNQNDVETELVTYIEKLNIDNYIKQHGCNLIQILRPALQKMAKVRKKTNR